MVHGHDEQVLVVGDLEQAQAQQRARREIEGSKRRLGGDRQRSRLTGVGERLHGERHLQRLVDHRHRPPVDGRERRAQHRVSGHEGLERARQGAAMERSAQAPHHRNRIGGAPRLELIDEPEPLLCERQRGPLASAGARVSGGTAEPRPWRSASSMRGASSAAVGASKSARSGSFDAERLTDARDRPG